MTAAMETPRVKLPMADSTYYSPTAWQPGRDEKLRHRGQLDTRSRSFRFQWAAGQKLSKEYVTDVVPGDFLEIWPPGQGEDTNWYVGNGRGKEKGKAPIAWINHDSIRFATLPSSSWRWLLLKAFAKVILLAGGALLLLQLLDVVFLSDRNPVSYINGFFIPSLIYVGGPCVLVWSGVGLIERLFPGWIYKDPKGPLWEFNRRTGLVTVFRNPKKKRDAGQIAWQSPFAEFDGYVHSGPTHQGLPL